jgi:LuxR family maltose regulon positive regulatory protein
LSYLLGNFPEAHSWLVQALDTARDANDAYIEANILISLALADAQLGDLAAAARRSEAAVTLFTAVEGTQPGGLQLTSLARANRGQIALLQGDLETAADLIEQARSSQHDLGYSWALGDTLRIAGDLAVRQGDRVLAMTRYRESLDQAAIHEDKRHLAETLVSIGILAAECGDPERAARSFGAASTLRSSSGAVMSNWTRPAYERAEAAARAALTPEVFAEQWAVGEGWSLDDAIADAGGIDPSAMASGEAPADAMAAFNLTPREVEVLRLLATGLSDREIGEALFVGTRTVNYHVANLLAKLELDSRVAAAAFAVRHGLG